MPAFWENHNYIQSVRFVPPSPDAQRQYPFCIPAVREYRGAAKVKGRLKSSIR